jgi:DNA-binding IclR family transcriptional regulator
MFTPENGHSDRANGESDPSAPKAPPTLVPAVAKAFRVLDLLGSSQTPLGVSELARRLALGKSTVHGLLSTLEALGMIEAHNGARRYRLGPGLRALASRALGRQDLRQLSRAGLERLAENTEQTSFLGVPALDTVTILDLVHGRPTMSISAPIGSSIPLLAGAVGKAILGAWDAQRRDALLSSARLRKFTANTITDPVLLRRAAEEAGANGAAIDVDEYVDGMRAAAAPIFGPPHELAGVIWVAGFSRHIDREQLASIAAAVAREAAEISRALGAH